METHDPPFTAATAGCLSGMLPYWFTAEESKVQLPPVWKEACCDGREPPGESAPVESGGYYSYIVGADNFTDSSYKGPKTKKQLPHVFFGRFFRGSSYLYFLTLLGFLDWYENPNRSALVSYMYVHIEKKTYNKYCNKSGLKIVL